MHDAMKAYHESWERDLDRQFLKNDRYRKRAYICSPLSGSTAEEELSNIWRARAYMLYARTMLGYLARAPHAYLPMLLCDHVAAERALALQFGFQLLEQSLMVPFLKKSLFLTVQQHFTMPHFITAVN